MSNSSCPGARRFSLSNCVLLHTSVGCIAAAMLRLRGAILKRSTVAPEGRCRQHDGECLGHFVRRGHRWVMANTVTTAMLARSKKPLMQFREFAELKAEVAAMRREREEARAEHDKLRAQLRAVSKAFGTLSDVVVDEIGVVKREVKSMRAELDALQAGDEMRWAKDLRADLEATERTLKGKIHEAAMETKSGFIERDGVVRRIGARVEEMAKEAERTKASAVEERSRRMEESELTREALETADADRRGIRHSAHLAEARLQRSEDAIRRLQDGLKEQRDIAMMRGPQAAKNVAKHARAMEEAGFLSPSKELFGAVRSAKGDEPTGGRGSPSQRLGLSKASEAFLG